jgi:hypothetical protein
MIVALAREYVASRDALIMDAWRNGGTFEGKKATDGMVLAYWKERQKGLDQNDPEYEKSKDQVMQLQYGIEQSKADVLHAQGKLSDTAYAQFFLRWAAKQPRNSEFYRTLQKDAAQLIEQAKERSRIDGERARTEAFNKFVQTTTDREIAIGDALTRALDDLSKKTGLSITGNGDELLALLTQDVAANPNSYRALTDTIHKADPDWDGQITEGYFSQHVKAAVNGYDTIADRAQKGGFVSVYANATQGMATMSAWGQNVKVWPAAQTYTTVMNSFYRVYNDPTASQMDINHAASLAATALQSLAATPGVDQGSKGMILADAQRLLGQDAGDEPSFGSSMLGRNGITPEIAMKVGALAQTSAEMQANPTAWAYAPVDKNGQFDASGQGALGMVPAGSIPPGAQGVMVPGRDGKAVLAMVLPHAVYTKDPANPSAAPRLSGQILTYNTGNRHIELWAYRDNNNQTHWSLSNPLAQGTSTEVDRNGDVFVTPAMSTLDPVAQAQRIDAQLGTNLAGQIQKQIDQRKQVAGQTGVMSDLGGISAKLNKVDANGHVVSSVEVSFDGTNFTATDNQNTLDKEGHVTATQSTPIDLGGTNIVGKPYSESRMTAGNIPGVTYTSSLQASVKAAAYTQTEDQVGKFASDPAFQQAFLSSTMQTLGTSNPYDARIAAAWKDITTATKAEYVRPTPQNAALRADLRYPGEEKNANAYQGQLNINYGNGQTLNIPGLPSYLKNLNINGGINNPYGAQANAPYTPLLAGLGLTIPPQMPQGSPAQMSQPQPNITPTATPTHAGVTPTYLQTAPAPAPTSTPAPAPGPGSSYTRPGQAPRPS